MPDDQGGNNAYDFTVEASDGNSKGTLAVTVIVNPVDELPDFSSGDDTLFYDENQTTAVETYAATDPEDKNISWSLTGDDANALNIDSASGVLTFRSAPNFEDPADVDDDGVYKVNVVPSDGSEVATLVVTVEVNDVPEPPVVSGPIFANFPENGDGEVGGYTVEDPEDGTITWSLGGSDATSSRIEVDPANDDRTLFFNNPPNFEAPRSFVYNLTLVASDGGITDSHPVTVTVTNVNEPPVLSGTQTGVNHDEGDTGDVETFTAADPDAGAVISWSVRGTDNSYFSIIGGVVTFNTPPDFEDPSTRSRSRAPITSTRRRPGRSPSRSSTSRSRGRSPSPRCSHGSGSSSKPNWMNRTALSRPSPGRGRAR